MDDEICRNEIVKTYNLVDFDIFIMSRGHGFSNYTDYVFLCFFS